MKNLLKYSKIKITLNHLRQITKKKISAATPAIKSEAAKPQQQHQWKQNSKARQVKKRTRNYKKIDKKYKQR